METEKQIGDAPLILERLWKWMSQKLREFAVPILTAFLFGFLAHGFAFTNKLVNHDEVFTLFFKGGSVSLGRWGLDFIDRIFPDYSMPWIYGIVTIALMAAAVCVMVHVFSIRSKLLQALLAGIVLVFPSLTGAFSYMFMSCTYSLSFLLAVIAASLVRQGKVKEWIIAIICMVGSLSLYQAHIAIAASLLVLVLIQRLLHETDVMPLIKKGIQYVLFLILSMGIYYIAVKVMQYWKNVGFNSYAAGNLSFDLRTIPSDIADAYATFFQYITQGYQGLIPTAFSRGVHMLCFCVAAILLLAWALNQKGKRLARFGMLFALIGILPLSSNCLHLFATRDSVHTLVACGFVSIYVLVVILAQDCPPALPEGKLRTMARSIALNLITLCLAVVIIVNTYIANESYLNLYLRYENACSFYTSLIADLKLMPEFNEDTKLAVIGTFQEPSFYLEKFSFSDDITGIDGFLPDSYSKDKFMEYYMGFPIEFATEQEIQEITATAEYAGMAVYPYYGSMQWFDNILAVKLS